MTIWLAFMEYLGHWWPQKCSNCRNHNLFLLSSIATSPNFLNNKQHDGCHALHFTLSRICILISSSEISHNLCCGKYCLVLISFFMNYFCRFHGFFSMFAMAWPFLSILLQLWVLNVPVLSLVPFFLTLITVTAWFYISVCTICMS